MAIGHAFRVTSALPTVARLVPTLLAQFRSEPSPADHSYRVIKGDVVENPFSVLFEGEVTFRASSELGAVDDLLWHINREAIGSAGRFVAVHASAASSGGRAVLLPATQDSGKSTTVAGLLTAGLTYLTDEAALIDLDTGELYPYAKPLWLSPASVRVLDGLSDRIMTDYRRLDRARLYVRPEDLGTRAEMDPCRIHLVVSPRFVPGVPTELESLSRAETLMCLAQNSFNLSEQGVKGIPPLRKVVQDAPGYRLTFSELSSAVPTILDLLDRIAR